MTSSDTRSTDFQERYHQNGFLPRVQHSERFERSSTNDSSSIYSNSRNNDRSNQSCSEYSTIYKGENNLSRPYNPYKNPFFLFLIALFAALIYLVIPSTNFWIYNLVKNQWWSLFVVIIVCEFEDYCLPDALPITYHGSYVVSFLSVVIIRLSQAVSHQENNFEINTLFVNAINLTVVIFYGLDTHFYNVQSDDVQTDRLTTSDVEVNLEGANNPLRESEIMASNKATPLVPAPLPAPVAINRLWHRFNQPTQPHLPTARPKCPLYDVFSISGCGAYSHVGKKLPSITSASLSAFRMEFLQAEREVYRLISTAESSTTTGESSDEQSRSRTASVLDFLPRYQYDRTQISLRQRITKMPVVLGNRKRLWLYGSLFTLFLGIHYTFLIYFTNIFRAYSNSGKGVVSGVLVELFFMYVVVCTVLRVFIKRLGMECDKMKMNTTSLFFVAEYFCLMFYYLFYRVLFESIPNWGTFFVLEICHLVFEWICYPLRASNTVNGYLTELMKLEKRCGCGLLRVVFAPYGLNMLDWQYFVALDFGIRCYVIIITGVSFTVTTLCISFIPWVHNDLAQKGSALLFTMAIVAVSIACEVVNAYLISSLFFRAKNLDVFSVVIDCFQDNRFAFITTVLGASLIMNPIYAFTTDNTF